MSDTDQTPPHVYGTLLVRDVPQARTVLGALCGTHADVEDDDDVDGTLEELLNRIADLVDEVIPPTATGSGPFASHAQVYLVGEDALPGLGGLINIQAGPPEFTQPEVVKRAEKFLDTCANIGVGGYVEVDVPGKYSERTVHVLTPTGLYSESAPSRFPNV
ncbi:MAG: hypothetical protein DI630_16440 [Gordonia sp. (in: high G+C Gram-positive bacteria)]|nr:MAG: hypothetical protein DI630_16440 [Gordonia sp. (in: high G+C Gram-positive bacteria)]